MNTELNLKLQVMNMNSHIPLIILISSRSSYIVRMLDTLADAQKKRLNMSEVREGQSTTLMPQPPVSPVFSNIIRINVITS